MQPTSSPLKKPLDYLDVDFYEKIQDPKRAHPYDDVFPLYPPPPIKISRGIPARFNVRGLNYQPKPGKVTKQVFEFAVSLLSKARDIAQMKANNTIPK